MRPGGHPVRPASVALVALTAGVMVSACSSSPGKTNCGSSFVRATGSGEDELLASCAGVVGIDNPVLRLDRHKSVRIVVAYSGVGVTLSAVGGGVVSIDGLKITARQVGTAVITQTGLTCTNQTDTCNLVRVIVR